MAETENYEPDILSNGVITPTDAYEDDMEVISSVEDYLRWDAGESFDAEFLAPPGSALYYHELDSETVERLLTGWTSQSDRAVGEDGFTLYMDRMWRDTRARPVPDEMSLEEIHEITETGLFSNFETRYIEGGDYSGILGIR